MDKDEFKNIDTLEGSSRNLIAIEPADVDLERIPKAIYVAVGGTLVITAVDDTTPITMDVGDKTYHPIRPKRIGVASTADGIVGLL